MALQFGDQKSFFPGGGSGSRKGEFPQDCRIVFQQSPACFWIEGDPETICFLSLEPVIGPAVEFAPDRVAHHVVGYDWMSGIQSLDLTVPVA